MNVKIANKYLNQNQETVAYIAVMEVFLVPQFSKTKHVANKTENTGVLTSPFNNSFGETLLNLG
jgi:hypothetical protein